MRPSRNLLRTTAVATLIAALAAGCASDPSSSAADAQAKAAAEVIAPNEHLKAEGIPPVPKALAERVAQYTEFKPVSVVAWHPVRDQLLVAYRRGATTQLHLLDKPMGALEPLTDFPDPVSRASFEPKRGDYLVYQRDTGGNEAAQLYRLDLGTRASTLLTDPAEKHALGDWNRAGTALVMTSTQLDKTAGAGGARDTVTTDLYVLDPLKPEAKRKITSLPGGGWFDMQWGANDRALYALEYRSATDSSVWRIDVATGKRTQVLPEKGAKKAAYSDLAVTGDGKYLLYASDAGGEFRQLTAMDLASGKRRVLTRNIPWDVDTIVLPDEAPGKRSAKPVVAALVNVAGRHELHLFDYLRGTETVAPLPPAALAGSVSRVALIAGPDRDRIALTANSARSPGDVYTIDLRSKAPAQQWTEAKVPGLDTASFQETNIVEWKSFDGLKISGLLTRPPAKFTGKRPVLVNIHGGPEGQATIGFLGRYNYFLNEMGVAVIQPNVRGSSGYGKTFISLDDGMKREDSVKDIGALLDWIATQPDLDASRVMVSGGSYGGYMSLAVATHYADRIAASIDVVGISSFTTFLQRTETYRRDLRRAEYGDERDPAMRAFFEKISPLANADRIRKPLFVVQGLNDPRVPWQEADQIVKKVRANGVPVWYLTADNEGHGFARKPNADFQFYAQILFMQQYLLN